jgi:hypothetical protein
MPLTTEHITTAFVVAASFFSILALSFKHKEYKEQADGEDTLKHLILRSLKDQFRRTPIVKSDRECGWSFTLNGREIKSDKGLLLTDEKETKFSIVEFAWLDYTEVTGVALEDQKQKNDTKIKQLKKKTFDLAVAFSKTCRDDQVVKYYCVVNCNSEGPAIVDSGKV